MPTTIVGPEIEAVASTIRELQVMTERKRRKEFNKAAKFFEDAHNGKISAKKLENFLEWSKTTDLFAKPNTTTRGEATERATA